MYTAAQGVGLGLRWQFLDEVLERLTDRPLLGPIEFFEVAPENYMRRGGYFPAMLEQVRSNYPLFSHGLTLNIGGVDPLDGGYLAELSRFLKRFEPVVHSDHLCFTGVGGVQLHDLFPMPFTMEAARHVSERLSAAQDFIKRPIALENITFYRADESSEMSELDFVCEVLSQSGAGLLLDVNNVWVNWQNHQTHEPIAFFERLPLDRVVSLHVAGHEKRGPRLIDTHGADVPDSVYTLVEWVISKTGPLPVVVERDHHIPPFDELLAEVKRVSAAYQKGLSVYASRRAGGAS